MLSVYICEGIFDLRIYVVITSPHPRDWGVTGLALEERVFHQRALTKTPHYLLIARHTEGIPKHEAPGSSRLKSARHGWTAVESH